MWIVDMQVALYVRPVICCVRYAL